MDYSLCKEDFWNLDPPYFEKLRWQMLNEPDPRWTIYSDKLKAKEIAIKNNVSVPKLLFKTKDPDSIDFSSLPDVCMFKANHGCGWNCLYYEGNFFFIKKLHRQFNSIQDVLNNANKVSKAQFLYFFRNILKRKFTDWKAGLCENEWWYNDIDPWVYAEEAIFIEDKPSIQIWVYCNYSKVVAIVMESLSHTQPVGSRSGGFRHYRYSEHRSAIRYLINNSKLLLNDFTKLLDDKVMNQLIIDSSNLGRDFEQIRIDFVFDTSNYYFLEYCVIGGIAWDGRSIDAAHRLNIAGLGRWWDIVWPYK